MKAELSIQKSRDTGEFMVLWKDPNGKIKQERTYYTDSPLDAVETLFATYNWSLKSDGAEISGDRFTQNMLVSDERA